MTSAGLCSTMSRGDERLRQAVARWIRARYLIMRPWMHPDGPNRPVTLEMVEAENELHAAFLGVPADTSWETQLAAAKLAGSDICPRDIKKPSKKKKARRARVVKTARPKRRVRGNLFDRS